MSRFLFVPCFGKAERLRLEVEKEQLMLQAAKVQDKEVCVYCVVCVYGLCHSQYVRLKKCTGITIEVPQ